MATRYSKPRTAEQKKHAERMRQEKVAKLHDRLAEAVQSIQSGDDWKRFLDASRKFHTYSARNVMLILSQNPDATRVAGFRTWGEFGRHVRKGEKGLQILRPVIAKPRADDASDTTSKSATTDTTSKSAADPAAEGRPRIVGYAVAHVFDVGQTDGEPLPEPPRVELLRGQAPAGLFDALAAEVESRGFTLHIARDAAALGGANGQTNYADRTVHVRGDVDDAQQVKTLAHELAHVMMHDPAAGGGRPDCRGLIEVEAESTAYIVAAEHGLDTSDYSFGYVAGWAGEDTAAIEKTAARVTETAGAIIEATTENIDQRAELAEQGRAANAVLAAKVEATHDHIAAGPTPAHRDTLDRVQAHFTAALPSDSRAVELLAERGISIDTAAAAGAGVAAAGSDRLPGTVTDLTAIGAVAPTGNDGWRKTFRDRLTFPLSNADGQVVGWTGRDLSGSDSAPKWLNSPTSEVFDKQTAAFRVGPAEADTVIVTEGAFDAIAVAQHHPKAIGFAPAGTALSSDHAQQLADSGKTIIVAFDGDEAGRNAAARTHDTLTEAGISNAKVATLPSGQDPADLAASDPSRLTAALADTRPLIAAKVDQLIAEQPDTFIPTRVNTMRQVATLLRTHPNPVERVRLIDQARQRLDLGSTTVESIQAALPVPGAARFPDKPQVRVTPMPVALTTASAAAR